MCGRLDFSLGVRAALCFTLVKAPWTTVYGLTVTSCEIGEFRSECSSGVFCYYRYPGQVSPLLVVVLRGLDVVVLTNTSVGRDRPNDDHNIGWKADRTLLPPLSQSKHVMQSYGVHGD